MRRIRSWTECEVVVIAKVYTVYDNKACSYLPPWSMPTRGHALRYFSDLARDESQLFCKHSTDFVLYEIGEFDDQVGVLKQYPEAVNLGLASSYKETRQ